MRLYGEVLKIGYGFIEMLNFIAVVLIARMWLSRHLLKLRIFIMNFEFDVFIIVGFETESSCPEN